MIAIVFKFQIERIRENLITFFLIVVTALAVLYKGYRDAAMVQSIAYLFVVWLCSFFADLYALWRPAKKGLLVRDPKRETIWFLLCAGLGLLGLSLRFCLLDWEHVNGLTRLATAPLILFFVFPIGLAAIFLILKYKLPDLGIRFQGLLVVLPVIAIFAITNRIVCPESLTWGNMIEESGGGETVSVILSILWSGFIMAALSEEFFRVIGQTRIGSLLHNFGIGWFITTVIWALMHTPKWYGEGHDMMEAIISAIRIVPLGLMWGYLTHRTKSMLPAVLIHGANVWGLQNF
jgi:membrane protease YdiL (CAAX protease family)